MVRIGVPFYAVNPFFKMQREFKYAPTDPVSVER
jgi:hypothetical protein